MTPEEPAMTVVVHLGHGDLTALLRALGPSFELDPQSSFETITATVRHVLRVTGTPYTVELFRLSDDAHDQERFARRRRVMHEGRAICLPTPEDVVITKLRWALHGGRGKDRLDARNVIVVQQYRLDWEYIHRWCDAHGTRALLDELRASIPPV